MKKKPKKTASAAAIDSVKERARAAMRQRREKGWRVQTPIWVQYQASCGKYCARIMDVEARGYGHYPSDAVQDLEFQVVSSNLKVPRFAPPELTEAQIDEAISGLFAAYFEVGKWETRLGFDRRGNPDSLLAFPWPPNAEPESIVVGVSTGDGLMAIRELARDGDFWKVKEKRGQSANFASAKEAFIAAKVGQIKV